MALSFSFRSNDDPISKQMAVQLTNTMGPAAITLMNKAEDFVRFFTPCEALRLMMIRVFTEVANYDPRFTNVAALFTMGEGLSPMTLPRLVSLALEDKVFNYFIEKPFFICDEKAKQRQVEIKAFLQRTKKRKEDDKEKPETNKRMKVSSVLTEAKQTEAKQSQPKTWAMNAMGLIKVGHRTPFRFAFVPRSVVEPLFQQKLKETKTNLSCQSLEQLNPNCEKMIGMEKESVNTNVFCNFIQAFVQSGKTIHTRDDILNYPILRIAFLDVLKKTIFDQSKRSNFQWLWQLNSLCGHLLVYGLDAKEPADQADYRNLFDLVSALNNGHKFHEYRKAQKGDVFRIGVSPNETMDQNAWVCRLVHYIVESQSLCLETESDILTYDDLSDRTEVYSVMHEVKSTGRKRWYEAGVCVMKHLITMVSLEVIHKMGSKATVPIVDALLLLVTQAQYLKLTEKMKELMKQNDVAIPPTRKIYLPPTNKKSKYLPKESFQIETDEQQTLLRLIMERILCRFIGLADYKLHTQNFFEKLAVLIVKAPKESFVAVCAPLESQLKLAEQFRFDSLRFALVMAEVILSLSMNAIKSNSTLFTEDVASMDDKKVRCYYGGLTHYKIGKLEDVNHMTEKLATIAICHHKLQHLDQVAFDLMTMEPKRSLSGSTVTVSAPSGTQKKEDVILHSTSIH